MSLDLDELDDDSDAGAAAASSRSRGSRGAGAVASAGERVTIERAFDKYDEDGSGAVDAAELANICSDLDAELSSSELSEAMKQLDKDGSGLIEKDEFVTWWMDRGGGSGRGGAVAKKLRKAASTGKKRMYTDIHIAAWKGDVDILQTFLDAEPSLVNARDGTDFGDGNTPLHYAAYNGHVEACEVLLASGADVDATNDAGCTPLFFAAQQGREAIVDVLLANAADVTAAEKTHGWSAVDVAATPSIAATLLEGGDFEPPQQMSPPTVRVSSSGMARAQWVPIPEPARGTPELPVVGYRMEVRRVRQAGEEGKENTFIGEIATGPGFDSCNVAGLVDGNTYVFFVAAKNAIGEGPLSEPSKELRFVRVPARPAAPRLVTVTGNAVEVEWDGVDGRGAPLTGYQLVRRSPTDTDEEPVPVDSYPPATTRALLTSDDLPEPFVPFELVLFAVSEVGQSRPSKPLLVEPPVAPDDDPFGVKHSRRMAAEAKRSAPAGRHSRPRSGRSRPSSRGDKAGGAGGAEARPRATGRPKRRKGAARVAEADAKGSADTAADELEDGPSQRPADIGAWDAEHAGAVEAEPTPGIENAAAAEFASNVLGNDDDGSAQFAEL